MTKLELSVAVLAAISLVGIIVLAVLDKSVDTLVPFLSGFVAFLLGAKKELIAAKLRRK